MMYTVILFIKQPRSPGISQITIEYVTDSKLYRLTSCSTICRIVIAFRYNLWNFVIKSWELRKWRVETLDVNKLTKVNKYYCWSKVHILWRAALVAALPDN